MAKSWATFGVDLHLDPTGPGVRRGLTDALREAVRTGRLAPGTRLPSSRALAADLGIARNTVADAYADLVAEGWLTARQGSATRVSDRTVVPPAGAAPRPREPGRPTHNLVPGTPDLASFPRAEWLKAARRALATAPYQALDYGDPRGRVELRTALAEYLSRARGVRADPDRILVCAGFSHGLRLLGAVLRARGARTVAVESYGLDVHWNLLAAAGLRTVPLPFDERGTDPGELTDQDAVLLTPAHQFPMGGTLHRDRRAAVVEWARRTGGLVVEDDYDGEFRYDRQPVGALQGLDPDHVVHAGTASKSLAPGLRLGWLVLPPGLMEEVLAVKGGIDTCGSLDQLTLAEFLTSGAYDRHVRAARLRYRRRRDALVAELARRAPRVHATGIAAGLHVVLGLPPGTEQPALRAAAWQGLAVHGLHRYQHPEAVVERHDALVVGYGTPPDHAWSGALEALCAVLPE
ncbi:GntR family transcriptional regulator/MocR family aminotransferase [Streptomyces sp. SAI-208]|uniref:MocR-like pyridoxine biosynthesis transcription factor PdxR n=1 Tax=unclassified Streptomyces TaxID=2593676 RepID=UPI002476FADB|nr:MULTISPECIES: PLP-dependent aminotransferase family protein [unclassified Streptomyces]MDH6549204.1 GntR family transcriptional regulator/MocR family aminotransferase [Streptomyces sp. SAI-041]MDH6568269.1 GntR family transcriptional regulator/MocR family aminotransferase [Streptomyces sp. SAI-117]MDH6607808.1 GntR family transcriptional regulator/MocR family aminotransferase [Streptomyces sp. SAI-208]